MENVWVYVYDLSEGFASLISQSLKFLPRMEGIWHSSLVLYGREIEYGPKGVICAPVNTGAQPVKRIFLGKTDTPLQTLLYYLSFLNETKFKGENYNFMLHNCHTFTDFLAKELTNKNIPDFLLSLPTDCCVSTIGVIASSIFPGSKSNVNSMMSLIVDKKNISWPLSRGGGNKKR